MNLQEITKDTAEIAARKMSKMAFDSYDVLTYTRDHALTRFANNVIHQQVDSNVLYLRLRAIKGNKLATVSSTGSPDDIASIVDNLGVSIDNAPSLPYLQGFIADQTYEVVDAMGEVLNPDERGEVVSHAVDLATDIDHRSQLFGKVETLNFYFTVMNSNGIDGSHAFNYTDYKFLSIIEEQDKRGYGRETCIFRGDVPDIGNMVGSAVKISQDTLNAKKIPADQYPVILRPQALDELIGYTLYGLTARNFHQGNSAFADKLGEGLLDISLTIEDRPLDSTTIFASPLDGEGVAKQNLSIIDSGVPKQVFYDTLSASQFLDDKNLTSGHGEIPYSDYSFGSGGLNITVDNGGSTEQQMIEDTQRGLLVQTFWYTNPVNMPKGIITSLTRDGLYLIEDGEISHAVRNMRFTDSFLSFFKKIEAISKNTYSIANEDSASILPIMKLENMRFTGQSKH